MRPCFWYTQIILTATVWTTGFLPAFSCDEVKQVSVTMVIKAKPELVWDAIQGQRKSDHEHRKLVSYQNEEAVIEEKFGGLPVIGEATCLYKECEIPLKRIDYSLISSDRFKTFEGSWTLTPSQDGQNTTLNLSSSADPGLRIPFWKELTKMATTKHVKKRLEDVRHDAESHSHLAQKL